MVILAGLSLFAISCDSGSSDSDYDADEEYEETTEECNRIYTNYMYCVNRCKDDGFCYEDCVGDYYVEFLDCCETYNAEISCIQGCYGDVASCFEEAYPLARITRKNCFFDFSDCCNGCPVPVASN